MVSLKYASPRVGDGRQELHNVFGRHEPGVVAVYYPK